MKVKLKGHTLSVTKEEKEVFYSETAFYYSLKIFLKSLGLDVIKQNNKQLGKEGHLTGLPFAITDRNRKFIIFDNDYCLRNIAKDFNLLGNVKLAVEFENEEVLSKLQGVLS